MSLDTKLSLRCVSELTSSLDLVSAKAPLDYTKAIDLATGTGAGQADKIFTDTRTLAASATENLDLAGSLSDALGASLTFARVKALIIAAAAGNTNNVLVGGAASNGFVNWVADATDVVVVRPGGAFALFASDATAYAVTAGTGDLLKVANSAAGTSVTYDVILIGSSA